MITITARIKAQAQYAVESVCEGDNTTITLAATEYGHHADLLAKALSKSPIYDAPNFAIVVRRLGAEYSPTTFCQGKKVEDSHWAWNIKWSAEAL